jgi:hypothetical protein
VVVEVTPTSERVTLLQELLAISTCFVALDPRGERLWVAPGILGFACFLEVRKCAKLWFLKAAPQHFIDTNLPFLDA